MLELYGDSKLIMNQLLTEYEVRKDDLVPYLPVFQRWVIPLITEMLQDDTNVISVLPVDTKEWRQPLIDYLEHGKLPNDPRHRPEIH
ncbi:hypothetical protein ACFX13_001019 [Malus domestica]